MLDTYAILTAIRDAVIRIRITREISLCAVMWPEIRFTSDVDEHTVVIDDGIAGHHEPDLADYIYREMMLSIEMNDKVIIKNLSDAISRSYGGNTVMYDSVDKSNDV